MVYKTPLILSLAVALVCGGLGCATKPDSIDRLVAALSAASGLYLNGFPRGSSLPQSASNEQLVIEAFRTTEFDPGRVTKYRILKIRHVSVGEGSFSHMYTAILADTNLGKKIVLTCYVKGDGSTAGYWWRRIYGVDPSNLRYY